MDRAAELAELLAVADVKATDDIAKAASIAPGILVVPVPTLTPETMTAWEAEWSIVCLTKQPANKVATARLHELVEHVESVLPGEGIVWTADAYQVTSEGVALPAYIGTFRELIEI